MSIIFFGIVYLVLLTMEMATRYQNGFAALLFGHHYEAWFNKGIRLLGLTNNILMLFGTLLGRINALEDISQLTRNKTLHLFQSLEFKVLFRESISYS